jgi:hypothetical protein
VLSLAGKLLLILSLPVVLLAISPIKINEPMALLLAVILSLLIMLTFLVGFYSHNAKSIRASYSIKRNSISNNKVILLALSSVFFSVYASYFYTGSIFEGYFNILYGESSSYENYQKHFSENELYTFSLSKIMPIISLAMVKFNFYYVIYHHYFVAKLKRHFFIIGISLLSFLHMSFSRGTSFELFEILFYFIFVLIIKNYFEEKRLKFPLIKIILIGIAFLSLYYINIELRYSASGGYLPGCHNALCYDENSYIVAVSETLSILLYKLSGYFNFGLIYIAQLLQFHILESPLLLLTPFSAYFSGNSVSVFCEDGTLSCGAMWTPSLVFYIYYLGLPILFLFIYVVGRTFSFLFSKFSSRFLFTYFIILYYLFLFIFSLPVGHLFSTSSSNKILFVVFSLLIILRLTPKHER